MGEVTNPSKVASSVELQALFHPRYPRTSAVFKALYAQVAPCTLTGCRHTQHSTQHSTRHSAAFTPVYYTAASACPDSCVDSTVSAARDVWCYSRAQRICAGSRSATPASPSSSACSASSLAFLPVSSLGLRFGAPAFGTSFFGARAFVSVAFFLRATPAFLAVPPAPSLVLRATPALRVSGAGFFGAGIFGVCFVRAIAHQWCGTTH